MQSAVELNSRLLERVRSVRATPVADVSPEEKQRVADVRKEIRALKTQPGFEHLKDFLEAQAARAVMAVVDNGSALTRGRAGAFRDMVAWLDAMTAPDTDEGDE